MSDKYSLNKNKPPLYGILSIKEFELLVDKKTFPKCEACGQPIYNPDFYDMDLCGPCCTGEASTIMKHPEDMSNKELKLYSDKLK